MTTYVGETHHLDKFQLNLLLDTFQQRLCSLDTDNVDWYLRVGFEKLRNLNKTLSRIALTTVILYKKDVRFRILTAVIVGKSRPCNEKTISSLLEVVESTHKTPSPNIDKTSSFCLFLIFNHKTCVIGNTSIHAFMAKFTAA